MKRIKIWVVENPKRALLIGHSFNSHCVNKLRSRKMMGGERQRFVYWRDSRAVQVTEMGKCRLNVFLNQVIVETFHVTCHGFYEMRRWKRLDHNITAGTSTVKHWLHQWTKKKRWKRRREMTNQSKKKIFHCPEWSHSMHSLLTQSLEIFEFIHVFGRTKVNKELI